MHPEDLASICPVALARSVMLSTGLMLRLNDGLCGEILSDMKDGAWRRRIPGARIKHRIKENWLKICDKDGSVLRVEMVINNPEEFKARKRVARKKNK